MQLRRYPEEPAEHKEQDERKYQVPPYGWSHGQIPALAPANPGAEDEYKVQQTGKEGSTQGNSDRYEEKVKAAAPQ